MQIFKYITKRLIIIAFSYLIVGIFIAMMISAVIGMMNKKPSKYEQILEAREATESTEASDAFIGPVLPSIKINGTLDGGIETGLAN